MHHPAGLGATSALPTFKELSAAATGGGHILKSILTLGRSELDLFDDDAMRTETENKKSLRDGDDHQKISAMKQLLAGFSIKRRFLRLFPEVVKIMGTSNLELKRLCYLFLILACQTTPGSRDSDEATAASLLTINGFQKDASHRNHVVRGWALKSMSLIRINEVVPCIVEAIRRGVGDGSPFVRQIVAQACPKLVAFDSTLVGLVCHSILVRLMADIEYSVVAAACQSMYQIILMFPDLLSLNPTDIRRCFVQYCLSTVENEEQHTSDVQPPFLSCLHGVYCRVIGNVLEGLPSYGQVTGIHLFTLYCRTFFLSPSVSPPSVHYDLFLSKLHTLKTSMSTAVVLASCTSLIALAEHTDKLFEDLVPYLLHRLHFEVNEAADIFWLLVAISKRYPPAGRSILPYATLEFHDSARLKRAKLSLLTSLAELPDFPLESTCDSLLATVHWNNESEDNWSSKEVFTCITSIVHHRLQQSQTVSLDRLSDSLLSLAVTARTPCIAKNAIEALCDVAQSSQSLSPERTHSILLLVARRLATVIQKNDGTLLPGYAAAIGLLSAHHKYAPHIAIDTFRLLVGYATTSVCSPCDIDATEVYLSILNFGASLWSFHGDSVLHSSSHVRTPGQLEFSNTVFPKLDRIWNHLLSYLINDTRNETVQKVAFLFSELSHFPPGQTGPSIAFRSVFSVPDAESVPSEKTPHYHQSGSSTTQQSLRSDIELIGTLSFSASIELQGLRLLPKFISDSDISWRIPAPDSMRMRVICPPVVSSHLKTHSSGGGSHHETKSTNHDADELDDFYKSADWTSHSLGTLRNDPVDPLVSLFGTRGVVIYGEETETDEEEDTMSNKNPIEKTSHEQLLNHPTPHVGMSLDEDEEDDWSRIKQYST